MRKIITVLALVLIGSGAFAQFNKGRMLVGGAFSFNTYTDKMEQGSTTTKNGTGVSFGVSPDFGYFIIDNLAVGASLGLGASSYNPNSNLIGKSSSTTASISPFVRYYLQPGFFFEGQVGGGSRKTKYHDPNNNTTTTGKNGLFLWSLGAGYAYFLNDFVAVEPILSFRGNSNKYKSSNPEYTTKSSGLYLSVGFQIYLGARN